MNLSGKFTVKEKDLLYVIDRHNPRECPKCLFTSDIAYIPLSGNCEYCNLQDQLRAAANPELWAPLLEKIKRAGENKQHDVLIGISGGEDSSIMLYMAVKVWNLRPLVIHFNNRTNRSEADSNIRVLTKSLNVNFIEYFVDQREYDDLCDSFLLAGVQDADIPNDIAMAKLMYSAARQYGIKYILNGHDFAREGSSPAAWSYMDALYVQSVYTAWTGKKLKNYPLYTFWDQIMSGILGIKQVRPFHFMPNLDRASILQTLKAIGWQDYGGKHNENIYTAFVGNFLLPRKFKIDKRRTYLSAQIREGYIDKEYAKEILKEPAEFNLLDLGDRGPHIMKIVDYSKRGNRNNYDRYNFKKWKPVIWLLYKMGIVAKTFFYKYTQ
jgi:hypothetical protein